MDSSFPYREGFESYAPGATPRYLSDHASIFEIVQRAGAKGKHFVRSSRRKPVLLELRWDGTSLVPKAHRELERVSLPKAIFPGSGRLHANHIRKCDLHAIAYELHARAWTADAGLVK
jgi:hypothetical protein